MSPYMLKKGFALLAGHHSLKSTWIRISARIGAWLYEGFQKCCDWGLMEFLVSWWGIQWLFETFLRTQGVATERFCALVLIADANLIPHRPHPAHPIQTKMHQTQQIQQKAIRFHRSLQAAPEAKEDGSAPCFVLHFSIMTVPVPHELTGKTLGSTLALSISIVAFQRQGSSMHFNLLGFHIHFPVWLHTIGGWLTKSNWSETGWKECNDEFACIVVFNTAVKQNFTL